MIKVLFFAKLREGFGQGEYGVEAAGAPLTIAALRERILGEQPAWREALCAANVIVALNQEVANLDTAVAEGDEVAFYPPVTGG